MQLSYQKLGTDHPMYGKVEYLVADGTQPVCYKTATGYMPIDSATATATAAPNLPADNAQKAATRPLFVLSFKVNGESEEMTFKSQKKLDKTLALLNEKPYITDFDTKTYQVML